MHYFEKPAAASSVYQKVVYFCASLPNRHHANVQDFHDVTSAVSVIKPLKAVV